MNRGSAAGHARWTRRAFLAATLATLAPGLARAGPTDPWSFVQLSDPQLGMWARNADTRQETASLEFAVAMANRLRPAFVIVTGAVDPAASIPSRRAPVGARTGTDIFWAGNAAP